MTNLNVRGFYFNEAGYPISLLPSTDMSLVNDISLQFRHNNFNISILDTRTSQEWGDLVTLCQARGEFNDRWNTSPGEVFLQLMGDTFRFTIRSYDNMCAYDVPTADVVSAFEMVMLIKQQVENQHAQKLSK